MREMLKMQQNLFWLCLMPLFIISANLDRDVFENVIFGKYLVKYTEYTNHTKSEDTGR